MTVMELALSEEETTLFAVDVSILVEKELDLTIIVTIPTVEYDVCAMWFVQLLWLMATIPHPLHWLLALAAYTLRGQC